MNRAQLLALREYAGAGMADAMHRVFEFAIPIAEEEIAAAIERWPLREPTLHIGFALLHPGGVLADCPERIYRAHCRELLERIATGEGDTRDATDAEVLWVLCKTSLVVSMTAESNALYRRLFRSCFPGEIPDIVEVEDSWDVHQPGVDDLLADARRKLRQSDRRIP